MLILLILYIGIWFPVFTELAVYGGALDGVIFGNYRLNILGKDMNRLWQPNLPFNSNECDTSSLYINSIIDIIKKTLNNRNIFLYCDFHGHSGKQNFFLYGCAKEGNENYHKKFMEIFAKKIAYLVWMIAFIK